MTMTTISEIPNNSHER